MGDILPKKNGKAWKNLLYCGRKPLKVFSEQNFAIRVIVQIRQIMGYF